MMQFFEDIIANTKWFEKSSYPNYIIIILLSLFFYSSLNLIFSLFFFWFQIFDPCFNKDFSMFEAKKKTTTCKRLFIVFSDWYFVLPFQNNPFAQSQDYSPKLKRFYTATVELNKRVALGEHKSFLVARFHEGELLSINFSGVNSRWKSFVS